jgi:hypothetical protein
VFCVGAADRYLALLDSAIGRTDDAVSELEAALELEARYPAPPLIARTQYWYGRTLFQRDRPGDVARARELVTSSSQIASGLGMTDLAAQARNLLRT